MYEGKSIKTICICFKANTGVLYRLIELALLEQAIIVTPDYRLLPESSGLDILSDLSSFWSWMTENLESTIAGFYPDLKLRPDFDRLLVTGGSGGGYLAAQSMLLHPEMNIKAVVMPYPMVDLRTRFWDEEFEKPIFGAKTVSCIIVLIAFFPTKLM